MLSMHGANPEDYEHHKGRTIINSKAQISNHQSSIQGQPLSYRRKREKRQEQ